MKYWNMYHKYRVNAAEKAEKKFLNVKRPDNRINHAKTVAENQK